MLSKTRSELLRSFVASCLIAVFTLICYGSAGAAVLPWDDPDMEIFDKLAQTAGGGDWTKSLGPVSYRYAVDVLDSIYPRNDLEEDLVYRLMDHFTSSTVERGPFSLYLSARADYLWAHSNYTKLLRVDAYTNPLLGRNEGMFIADGNLGVLGTRVRGRAGKYISFAATPMVLFSTDTEMDDHTSFYLKEGLITFHLRDLALDVGRGSVMWGVGRAGHMIFSGETEPFNMVRLRTDRPVIMPGFLRHLGPSSFETFITYMDKNRNIPHARLFGVNFSFRPHKRLEFSLGESVMFGGDGAPSNNPLIIFSEKVTDYHNPANRNFLITARYRVPYLEIEPYLEFMVEDCCATNVLNPRDNLQLAGIYFPQIDPYGRADFTVEWVRTNEITYRHGTFSSGYVYKGRIIGHGVGPDATGIYAVLRIFYSADLWGKLSFAFEERGRLNKTVSPDGREVFPVTEPYDVPENRYRFEASAEWSPVEGMYISPVLGLERVTNMRYVKGWECYQGKAGFTLRWIF